jgi:hypothetical protein
MKASSATTIRRLIVVTAVTALLSGVGAAVAASPFGWLVPRSAPAGWKHLALPAHGAILSYPPSLAPITGDKNSISVGKRDRSGTILVYLDATPKQGSENLSNWPTYRMQHLRGETNNVHELAQMRGLPFSGGVGSCVIDTYVTRGKLDDHYQEIACFVQGRSKASVVVAAALRPDWAQASALLERAVSAYRA